MIHVKQFQYCGKAIGTNKWHTYKTLKELMEDWNLFDFWQCDTKPLSEGNEIYSYQLTGMPICHFETILYPIGINTPNPPSNRYNVHELNSSNVKSKLLTCFSSDIEHLRNKTINNNNNNDNDEKMNNLRHSYQVCKRFIVVVFFLLFCFFFWLFF